mmetsp:Transcript_35724/g.107435  ORF Transcript_35724/g.107435 Transcript_35724/m.107435 type:complete len:174 (-) Transcript_35724:55-576(-)
MSTADESRPLVETDNERRAQRAKKFRNCLAKGQWLSPFIITKIGMGAAYLNDCGGEPRVPKWLLASGILQLPLVFLMFFKERMMIGLQEKFIIPPWFALELLLDIIGASIVFSHSTPPDNCVLVLWQFAGLFVFAVLFSVCFTLALIAHQIFCPETKCYAFGNVVVVSTPRQV